MKRYCITFNYAFNYVKAKTKEDLMEKADMIARSYNVVFCGLRIWKESKNGEFVNLIAERPAFISGHVLHDNEIDYGKSGHLGKWRVY